MASLNGRRHCHFTGTSSTSFIYVAQNMSSKYSYLLITAKLLRSGSQPLLSVINCIFHEMHKRILMEPFSHFPMKDVNDNRDLCIKHKVTLRGASRNLIMDLFYMVVAWWLFMEHTVCVQQTKLNQVATKVSILALFCLLLRKWFSFLFFLFLRKLFGLYYTAP